MPTVPQPYTYLIADIPGGQFTGESSDHLLYLIQTQLPTGQNPVINSDGLNVVVEFSQDLTTEEKSTLDTLIPHCADFFIITSDGGVTDLGNPALISKTAGLSSATTITLRYKMGDGSNFNGFQDPVNLISPVMTIDKIQGQFDNTGLFQFVIGAELNRGTVSIEIDADSLPRKTITATWT